MPVEGFDEHEQRIVDDLVIYHGFTLEITKVESFNFHLVPNDLNILSMHFFFCSMLGWT